MVRTQIQLTEEQSEALKRVAAQENVSVAEIIRRSIDAQVCSQVTHTAEERRRRALELSGMFHSGLDDLGSDHDRYLAEDFAA
jgi:hypothetical protein